MDKKVVFFNSESREELFPLVIDILEKRSEYLNEFYNLIVDEIK